MILIELGAQSSGPQSLRVISHDPQINSQGLAEELDELEELRDIAYIRQIAYQRKAATFHDRKVKSRDFRLGDIVLRTVVNNR